MSSLKLADIKLILVLNIFQLRYLAHFLGYIMKTLMFLEMNMLILRHYLLYKFKTGIIFFKKRDGK